MNVAAIREDSHSIRLRKKHRSTLRQTVRHIYVGGPEMCHDWTTPRASGRLTWPHIPAVFYTVRQVSPRDHHRSNKHIMLFDVANRIVEVCGCAIGGHVQPAGPMLHQPHKSPCLGICNSQSYFASGIATAERDSMLEQVQTNIFALYSLWTMGCQCESCFVNRGIPKVFNLWHSVIPEDRPGDRGTVNIPLNRLFINRSADGQSFDRLPNEESMPPLQQPIPPAETRAALSDMHGLPCRVLDTKRTAHVRS